MNSGPEWLYPATIVVLLILAYMQWQINAKKTMVLILVVLGYIIYSHETGHSLTQFKDDSVESFDKAVGNSKYDKSLKSKQLSPDAARKAVEGNSTE